MLRQVLPELLDHLPADDPEAIRSRRDLRVINFLMGNERWIVRQARLLAPASITELGAGEGILSGKLAAIALVEGYDLAPRPTSLDPRVTWHQGDLFATTPVSGDLLVANLFLHHFEGESMKGLARWCAGFQSLCFVEPLRTPGALRLGAGMLPFVNRITRHDMPVSIRAGFLPGELPQLLELDPGKWHVREQTTWRGGIRVVAWRA